MIRRYKVGELSNIVQTHTLGLQQAIICDINNTLIDKNERPISAVIEMINDLSDKYQIILLTADNLVRDEKRADMLETLKEIGVEYDRLICRNSDNHQEIEKGGDADIKEQLYCCYVRDFYHVVMVIDNNKDDVKMYRKLGLNTMRFKGID